MRGIDVLQNLTRGAFIDPAIHPRRQCSPKAVKFILPVWGYGYIRSFLNHVLPTLLAPDNLPAVVRTLPSEFLLLTRAADEMLIRQSPAFKRLSAVCSTQIGFVDHFVGVDPEVTITLAYTQIIRSSGDAMLDTCFFLLTSDRLMANGSLATALALMQCGASGVLTGDFEVSADDALPWLEEKLQTSSSVLALTLKPRIFMRWAMDHMHPTTIGNIVNFGLNHHSDTSHLFWQVDANTLLGRFYHMYMLCVRPELSNFVISSSLASSFVPELCPSGNVAVVTDSDDGLVVKLRPRDYNSGSLRLGPLTPAMLAKSLDKWATASHRGNAQHCVIYHSEAVPNSVAETLAASTDFVAHVARRMRRKPRPHRADHRWRNAIISLRDQAS